MRLWQVIILNTGDSIQVWVWEVIYSWLTFTCGLAVGFTSSRRVNYEWSRWQEERLWSQEEARRTTRPANDKNINVYVQWCVISEVCLGYKTHNNVAKSLLNAAELLDNEPTLRYTTDRAWHVDFNCLIIIYRISGLFRGLLIFAKFANGS